MIAKAKQLKHWSNNIKLLMPWTKRTSKIRRAISSSLVASLLTTLKTSLARISTKFLSRLLAIQRDKRIPPTKKQGIRKSEET